MRNDNYLKTGSNAPIAEVFFSLILGTLKSHLKKNRTTVRCENFSQFSPHHTANGRQRNTGICSKQTVCKKGNNGPVEY